MPDVRVTSNNLTRHTGIQKGTASGLKSSTTDLVMIKPIGTISEITYGQTSTSTYLLSGPNKNISTTEIKGKISLL